MGVVATEQAEDIDLTARLAQVARATANSVILMGPDGRITWVNEAFTRITEFTPEEARGEVPCILLAHPDTDPEAVAGVIRSLAVEMGQYGVRANVVAPGLIITPMMGPADGPAAQYLEKTYGPQTPARRVGYPEDFEGIGAYLCSDSSSFLTGQTIYIDGGYQIRP